MYFYLNQLTPPNAFHSFYFTISTHNGNLGGVRAITQKALHGLSGTRTVSVQEAVHLVDNQDLVICSEKFTMLSIRAGAMMASEKDKEKKDIVSMYRNRKKSLEHLTMDEYFYTHFCKEVLHDDICDPTERLQ